MNPSGIGVPPVKEKTQAGRLCHERLHQIIDAERTSVGEDFSRVETGGHTRGFG